nr:hypothetical protein GCM10020185_04660 [Pseudomonas brassicacearum subsp. brassicacearum]
MAAAAPHGHQGNRQADAEAQDEQAAQRDFFDLETQQQDGNGRGARNQPARQAEHDDLAGGDLPVGEALADIIGMRLFVGVLVTLQRQRQAFGFGMPVVMFVVVVMMIVIVIVIVMMVVVTLREPEHLLAAPGTPQHPQRDGNDQRSGCQLEIRLGGFGVQLLAQVHAADRDQPHHRSVG